MCSWDWQLAWQSSALDLVLTTTTTITTSRLLRPFNVHCSMASLMARLSPFSILFTHRRKQSILPIRSPPCTGVHVAEPRAGASLGCNHPSDIQRYLGQLGTSFISLGPTLDPQLKTDIPDNLARCYSLAKRITSIDQNVTNRIDRDGLCFLRLLSIQDTFSRADPSLILHTLDTLMRCAPRDRDDRPLEMTA